MAHPDEPQAGGPGAFSVVRHGYDRTQVNRYFQQAEAAARQASAEREQFQQQVADLGRQLDAARAHIASLTARLDKPGAEPAGGNRDERSARVLATAKSQAAE